MSASDKTKLDGLRSSPIIYPTSIKLSSAVSVSSNKSITDSTAVSTVYSATSTARTITNNSSGPLSIMVIKGISGAAASGVTVPGVLYGTPCTEGEISVSGSTTEIFILPPGQSRSYSISGSNLYIAVFRN